MKLFNQLLFLLVWLNAAVGQSTDTLSYPYQIRGFVLDTEGNPLIGVSVLSPGDGNHQVSGIDGGYYAYIYSPNTPVLFDYGEKYTKVFYCPDERREVNIVLEPIKNWRFKSGMRRIGHLFKLRKRRWRNPCR
ncbi:MAG: hypothetical protein AAF705_00400 [Bacteroidota bacterium]